MRAKRARKTARRGSAKKTARRTFKKWDTRASCAGRKARPGLRYLGKALASGCKAKAKRKTSKAKRAVRHDVPAYLTRIYDNNRNQWRTGKWQVFADGKSQYIIVDGRREAVYDD